MSDPVSVALTWLNFPLSVLLAVEGSVASVTNVYYDMDITILKALFLENDGVDYFKYANNRIFQTLDVAKFTTSATPPVLMQDHALQYVADQSSLVLANVTNQSAWLTAFRAAMETQLTALDATAMGYDMGSGPTFTPLDPGITLSRTASTDEVQIGGATFTSLPFVVGDAVYFDVACTFANSITKTYRVNLRARAPIVQVYPMLYLPPPSLIQVNVYLLKPESVTPGTSWTVNGTPYPFPFVTVGGVTILLRHGFYVIYSSSALTIGGDVPAGVLMTGDAAVFDWLLQESATVFDAVPTLHGTVFVNNVYYTNFLVSNYARLTTQGKLVVSFPSTFTAVDDRIHDSGAAYDTLGFTRQQPYRSQRSTYFQCTHAVPSNDSNLGHYIDVTPYLSDSSIIIVTTADMIQHPYSTTDPDFYDGIVGKKGNIMYVSDPNTISSNSPGVSLQLRCVVHTEHYVAVAPLPVNEGVLYENNYVNDSFLGLSNLFSDKAPSFTLTGDKILYRINLEYPLYNSFLIYKGAFKFLQIERPTPFTVGVWEDAGFHEARVAKVTESSIEQPQRVLYMRAASDMFNDTVLNQGFQEMNGSQVYSYSKQLPLQLQMISTNWKLNMNFTLDTETTLLATVKTRYVDNGLNTDTEIGTGTFTVINSLHSYEIPVTIPESGRVDYLVLELTCSATVTTQYGINNLTIPSLDVSLPYVRIW